MTKLANKQLLFAKYWKSSNVLTKAKWITSIAVMVLLTLYLFIFYSSTAYAIFGGGIYPENGLFQQIFNMTVFFKAWADGVFMEFFVIMIAFVLIGVGFLIRKNAQTQGLSAFTILVIFIYNCLLALQFACYYGAQPFSTFDAPNFRMIMELMNHSTFWIVLLCGFVLHAVWIKCYNFDKNSK